MAENYEWQKQTFAEDCEEIECPAYDPIGDFKQDPTGYYVLVRTNSDEGLIEVAIVNSSHQIEKVFRGKKCQDLYAAIFKYEAENNLRWFQEPTHLAYLGKELKKAELALKENTSYYQE